MKGHARSLHVIGAEPEVPLKLVEDYFTGGVDAEVVEGELIVGDVRSRFGVGAAEEVAPNEGAKKEELFREGEDERAESGDVGFESSSSYFEDIAADGETLLPLLVFFLVHASVLYVLCEKSQVFSVGISAREKDGEDILGRILEEGFMGEEGKE